jgi:hypothetical protein
MVSEGQRAVGEAAGIGAEPVASVRKCVLPMTSITLNRCEASSPDRAANQESFAWRTR